jgi:hypothetical protein
MAWNDVSSKLRFFGLPEDGLDGTPAFINGFASSVIGQAFGLDGKITILNALSDLYARSPTARCGIRLIARPINPFGGREGAFSGMDRVGASVARSFVVNGRRGGLVANAIQPRRSYAFAQICPQAGRDHGRDSTRRRTPGGINSDDPRICEAPRSEEFPCDVLDRAIPHQPDCRRPGIVS